jgi:hypothetical protein
MVLSYGLMRLTESQVPAPQFALLTPLITSQKMKQALVLWGVFMIVNMLFHGTIPFLESPFSYTLGQERPDLLVKV